MGNRRLPAVLCSLAVLGAGLSAAAGAAATERQWHAGGHFGYATAAFPEATVGGPGGGLQLTYGLTDAWNLRLHLDVASFALPISAVGATIWNVALGAEYIVDILTWVPYIGVAAGPVDVLVEQADHALHLGVEIPAGLGYRLLDNLTIFAEGRYRLLFLGTEQSPAGVLMALGRIDYVWGR